MLTHYTQYNPMQQTRTKHVRTRAYITTPSTTPACMHMSTSLLSRLNFPLWARRSSRRGRRIAVVYGVRAGGYLSLVAASTVVTRRERRERRPTADDEAALLPLPVGHIAASSATSIDSGGNSNLITRRLPPHACRFRRRRPRSKESAEQEGSHRHRCHP